MTDLEESSTTVREGSEPQKWMGGRAIVLATPSAKALRLRWSQLWWHADGTGPRLCNINERFFGPSKNLDPVDLKANLTTKWTGRWCKNMPEFVVEFSVTVYKVKYHQISFV